MILYIHTDKEVLMHPDDIETLFENCIRNRTIGTDDLGNIQVQILAQKCCLNEKDANDVLAIFEHGFEGDIMLRYSYMGHYEVYLNWD